jgi:GH25 family lysozyme M1 (1,4-beta-N-acetylmuramidase)
MNTYRKIILATLCVGVLTFGGARNVQAAADTQVTLTVSDYNKVDIEWPAVEGAAFYRIYRSTTQTGGYKRIKTVYGTSYTVTADTGVVYYYKIMPLSYDAEGKKVRGKCFAPQSIKAMMSAPTGVTVSNEENNSLTVSWTLSDADGYAIFRSTEKSSGYKVVKKVAGDVNTWTDTNVEAGTKYYYKVSAGKNTGTKICYGKRSAAKSGVAETEASEDITVAADGSISTSTRTLYLGLGEQKTLGATSDMSGTLRWVSDNPAVATVSEDGTVTGIAQGSTVVRAVIDSVCTEVSVTVTDATVNGIDVSKWQQAIDWSKVKASGIEFAMLRLTHGTSKDIQFENYYSGAKAQGIKVGIYCYTLAASVDEGIAEAQNLLTLLDGRELDYPVALDLEDDVQIKNMTKAQRTQLILEYKQMIEDAGYDFVVYANLNWLKNYIDQTTLQEENIDIWIARYRSQSLGYGYEGCGNVRIWQYSSSGQVDGILDAYGRYINVDLDVCYDDY